MESKDQNSPKWDWLPCNYNLKTEIKKKIHVWNLQPGIVLTNPSDEVQQDGQDPIVKLYLDTEKQLQYSNQIGWNWHKSWNLPNISVRIDIKDRDTNDPLLCPKNLFAQLFAVKAVIDQPDHFHLVDVGIRGQSKIEMINGQAFFTAIKFYSTSYNNEGVKFHLVLVIFIQNEEDEIPKVLNATISPPIFVDSRKSARDQQFILEKKMNSFVQPFSPETLEKDFIKRENKRKSDVDIKISNDREGLYNYLTAPNIRHKVKHPLFLCIKFYKTCKLFYNTNLIEDHSVQNILEVLQKKLTKDHYVPVSSNQQAQNEKMDDKMFILYVQEDEDGFKNKKINESIEPLICQSLGIIYNINLLPPLFNDLAGQNEENIEDLPDIYKSQFQNLQQIVKQIKNYDEDELDNGEKSEDDDFLDMNVENGDVYQDNDQTDKSRSESQDQKPKPSKKQKVNPKIEQNILIQQEKVQKQSNEKPDTFISIPLTPNMNQVKEQNQKNEPQQSQKEQQYKEEVKPRKNSNQMNKQQEIKQEKSEQQFSSMQSGQNFQNMMKNMGQNQYNNMMPQNIQQMISNLNNSGNNYSMGGNSMNSNQGSSDMDLQMQILQQQYMQMQQQMMNQNPMMSGFNKSGQMNFRNMFPSMNNMNMNQMMQQMPVNFNSNLHQMMQIFQGQNSNNNSKSNNNNSNNLTQQSQNNMFNNMFMQQNNNMLSQNMQNMQNMQDFSQSNLSNMLQMMQGMSSNNQMNMMSQNPFLAQQMMMMQQMQKQNQNPSGQNMFSGINMGGNNGGSQMGNTLMGSGQNPNNHSMMNPGLNGSQSGNNNSQNISSMNSQQQNQSLQAQQMGQNQSLSPKPSNNLPNSPQLPVNSQIQIPSSSQNQLNSFPGMNNLQNFMNIHHQNVHMHGQMNPNLFLGGNQFQQGGQSAQQFGGSQSNSLDQMMNFFQMQQQNLQQGFGRNKKDDDINKNDEKDNSSKSDQKQNMQ